MRADSVREWRSGYTATYERAPRAYDIVFDLAGGELGGRIGTVTSTVRYGDTIVLPEPTREGYVFKYWKGSVYKSGESYDVVGSHTFTAIWEKVEDKTEKPAEKEDAVTPAKTAETKVAAKTASVSHIAPEKPAASVLPATSDAAMAFAPFAAAGFMAVVAGARRRSHEAE